MTGRISGGDFFAAMVLKKMDADNDAEKATLRADLDRLRAENAVLVDALKDTRLELYWCAKQLAAHGQTGHEGDSVSRALDKSQRALAGTGEADKVAKVIEAALEWHKTEIHTAAEDSALAKLWRAVDAMIDGRNRRNR